MIAVHLNRALLHLVFRDPAVRDFGREDASEEQLVTSARNAAINIFPKVAEYLEEKHPYDYLASFCKNREKCAIMSAALLRQKPVEIPGAQLSFVPTMFGPNPLGEQ